MGFKDLSFFNLVMSGKQGWKFITETHSLVSRIFKARHFPHGSYLTARIGHSLSYVWCSILQARFLVKGGSRWCIGTGICIDGSIPCAHFVSSSMVADLIDASFKSWNVSVVSQVFSHDIETKILNTPFFPQVSSDRLIWKAEKNGTYSVKSAYRLCVTELLDISYHGDRVFGLAFES